MARAPVFSTIEKTSLRSRLVALMEEERHEEALELLYQARSTEPNNAELIQSIDHLKGYLVGVYAERLGSLDRIAPALPSGTPRSAETTMLIRYMNESSSFGDLAAICPLGKLRTLQLLVELFASPTDTGPKSNLRSGTVRRLRPADESVAGSPRAEPEDCDAAPQTARSPSSIPRGLGVTEFSDPRSEDARRYKELFAKGSAAFVQERYEDAVDAFGVCVELRERDRAASVMLRRSIQGLKGQVR